LEILADGSKATGVSYLDITDPDHLKRCVEMCDYVVVSCGAVQSARLLLLSGPPGGLGNESDQVGRNITFHLFGLGVKVTLSEKLQGYLHGEFGPTGNTSTFGAYFVQDHSKAWIKAGHITSAAKKNPLDDAVGALRKGAIGAPLLKNLQAHNRTLEVRLTGDDLPMPDNRVTLDPTYVDEYGLPVARIARKLGANERALFKASQKTLESIFNQYEAKKLVESPVKFTEGEVALIGDHQMGSCRMGNDPKDSAVNKYCRLHTVPNLFVVDSSFMPTGLGLNPMVTVVANALRVGTHIADRLSRGESPG
jgi:choline dehydrogenase-like flavoprotein